MSEEQNHSREILGRARLGVAVLVARTVVVQLVVLGGNVYLTRVLSPGDFGVFAIVQFVMSFFDLLGDAGLAAALISEKKLPDRRTMSSVFWLQVLLALGVIGVVWAVSGAIVRQWPTLPPEAPWLLRALSLVLLLTVLRTPCSIQMERKLQFGRVSTIEVIARMVYYGVAVSMARAGYGAAALLSAVIAQAGTSMVLAQIASPFRPELVLDRAVLGPIVRYGATVQLRSVVGYINGAITPLFAGSVLGRHALGLNNWAQGFAYFPLELVQIISRANFAAYSQIRDDREAFERAFEQSIERVALVSFFFTGLVWGLGPSLVQIIYTDKWLPAMPSLYIYSGAMTVGCLSPLVASALDAIGKPGILSKLTVGWVTLNWIVVGVTMTIAPGLTRFAAAYCVHVVVGNLAILVVLRREFPGVAAGAALRAPVAGLLAATAVGCWGLRPLIHGPATLVAAILAMVAVFVGAVVATNQRTMEQLRALRDWVDGRLGRRPPWAMLLSALAVAIALTLALGQPRAPIFFFSLKSYVSVTPRRMDSMTSLPLVSVVLTSYNYGRFLREAVMSVLDQSFKDTEIIVVDDGSSDETAEVAQGLPVRYVYQKNGGVCRARNHGASLARGELLMFLDADDVLRPSYIEKCHRALVGASPGVAYAYTQMEYFGDHGGVFHAAPFSRKRMLKGGFIHASALMRREVFERSGGYSIQWVRGHEDMELWVRLYTLGYEGVLVPEPLLLYRRHGSTRNTLSKEEIRQLDLELWTAYPGLYWPKLLAHPVAWLRQMQR